MTVLEIIILVPTIYLIYKGWKRGIIFEAAALVGIIAGCYAAIHFSKWVAELLNIEGEGTFLAAFIVTFVGVIVLSFFLGKCVEGFIKLVKVNVLNKILGAVLGMAKALCILSILFNYILVIDVHEHVITPKTKEKSVLFEPTIKLGTKMTSQLKTYAAQMRQK